MILAEEVKTASQGEVIGLFIKEKIPRGMTLAETVAEIRRQGGLVYVPHPFDRMHSVPDYEHLLDDRRGHRPDRGLQPARGVRAPSTRRRSALPAKYRIPAGAGSDAHVAQGLGTARMRMHDFDGPEEFLESLRAAEIRPNPTNYVYVQALKFLQTRATPAGGPPVGEAATRRRATRKG